MAEEKFDLAAIVGDKAAAIIDGEQQVEKGAILSPSDRYVVPNARNDGGAFSFSGEQIGKLAMIAQRIAAIDHAVKRGRMDSQGLIAEVLTLSVRVRALLRENMIEVNDNVEDYEV